jgi:hypothetical protein
MLPSASVIGSSTVRQCNGQSASVVSKHSISHVNAVFIISSNTSLVLRSTGSLLNSG